MECPTSRLPAFSRILYKGQGVNSSIPEPLDHFIWFLNDDKAYARIAKIPNLYGDGHAASRISKILKNTSWQKIRSTFRLPEL